MKLVRRNADGTTDTHKFRIGEALCGRGGQYFVLEVGDLQRLAEDIGSGSQVVREHLVEYFRADLPLKLCPWPKTIADPKADVIRDAQKILSKYLPPDGISQHQALTELLDLLDGPRARAALGDD